MEIDANADGGESGEVLNQDSEEDRGRGNWMDDG